MTRIDRLPKEMVTWAPRHPLVRALWQADLVEAARSLSACQSVLLARGYVARQATADESAALAQADGGAREAIPPCWVVSRMYQGVPLDVIGTEELLPQDNGPPKPRPNLLVAIAHPSLAGTAQIRPRLLQAIVTAGDGHGPLVGPATVGVGLILGAALLVPFALLYPVIQISQALNPEAERPFKTRDSHFDRRYEAMATSPEELARALPERLRRAFVETRFAGVATIAPGLMVVVGAPVLDPQLLPSWLDKIEPLAASLHRPPSYR